MHADRYEIRSRQAIIIALQADGPAVVFVGIISHNPHTPLFFAYFVGAVGANLRVRPLFLRVRPVFQRVRPVGHIGHLGRHLGRHVGLPLQVRPGLK